MAKVIDFGLAKSLGAGEPSDASLIQTTAGMFIGTPLYMAPERFGVQAADVDIRDDVYALGNLLYELLTGTTPIEAQRCAGLSWDELLRLIREDDPPSPSARLRNLENNALDTATALTRRPMLSSQVARGDLDWIPLKAIEKDRQRRYLSANALADDMRRYLSGEPVSAVPPSRTYRQRTLLRKHRDDDVVQATICTIRRIQGG